jgi:hypothetical protein
MMEATCEPGNRIDTRTKLIREGRWMSWCHGVRGDGNEARRSIQDRRDAYLPTERTVRLVFTQRSSANMIDSVKVIMQRSRTELKRVIHA